MSSSSTTLPASPPSVDRNSRPRETALTVVACALTLAISAAFLFAACALPLD